MRLQFPDDAEEYPRFRFRQRRRRFVENQHPAVERECLGNLHQLLAGNRQVANPLPDVDGRQPVHDRLRVAFQPAVIHQKRPAAACGRHENVLGDAGVGAKRDFLMHQSDAQ